MIIEDAVEDYLIYAYFELDYPHRCYVGKTLQSRAEQRDQEHRAGKSGATKFNTFVNAAFIYGDRDFDDVLRYEILEHFTGTAQECAEKEGEHIQRKNSIENGWNLKPEGTGNGLLFPSPTTMQHRPQIRRSRTNIQGDLGEEIIQDVIEFGLEQSIIEKDKEYSFQELKTLIAKSYVAHANQSLNLTVQEPAPDEIKSVLNDWTKLENSKNTVFGVRWWEEQLEKSGFERPLDWKNIPNIIRLHCRTVHSFSPIVQWLKGNPISLDINLPRLDRKWFCYGGSEDVWQVIRYKFLAKFPNTLQEIEEKEEADRQERLQKEKEEQERLQREREEQERIRKEREEQERQERIERKKEEAERLQREREEQERIRKEREEQERQERIEREKEEAERLQKEKEEQERIRKKREEQELQEWIRKKREEAARIQREREEQARLQKRMEEKEEAIEDASTQPPPIPMFQRGMEEKEEAIGKVAERKEKERIQRVAQAKPDLAIVEKQVTRAGSGGCGCIIFSIISITYIICVLVSCIEE